VELQVNSKNHVEVVQIKVSKPGVIDLITSKIMWSYIVIQDGVTG
jgi:hypothetical protein